MKSLGTTILTACVTLGLSVSLHAAATVHCGATLGTRFNLEPAASAVPQEMESLDFIPNRVALNEDLVVAGAFDSRGTTFAQPSTRTNWDGSVSGYYVRRAATTSCAPQFEGGLPAFTANGNSFSSNGGVVIAADPARDAFFAVDLRYSPGLGGFSAIGLFRASSATLLNATLCPNGTHTTAQATSCWMATHPAIIGPTPSGGINNADDYPSLAVDERPTTAGKGAGNVYVAYVGSIGNGIVGVELVACTNATLSCSKPVTVSAVGESVFFSGASNGNVQVRPDGKITVTYMDQTSNTDAAVELVQFVSCTPAGAPTAPVCTAPTTVATEKQSFGTFVNNQALSSQNMLAYTNSRHAHRLEADGKTITTFVVWDRCAEYFTFVGGLGTNGISLCLNADVVMSTSTNDGASWSAVTGVNTGGGHQFFPSISTDASTGTVNIAYYNTGHDPLHKRIVVSLNQIAPGTTTVGAPILLTTTPIPWDADPNQSALPLDDFDFHFGIKARGMGTAGFSRVYASFTSTGDRFGIYKGLPMPEQNNNLQEVTY
ncbi:MAG TPA: hypothetical protein VFO39_20165 [Candidatus Sulfotelmatobacter sp.]|nr:hypothetical protein [Candidatus Sulfotelmatobacter sp.]